MVEQTRPGVRELPSFLKARNGVRLWNGICFVSLKNRYLYVENPKCGSSTLKHFLAGHEAGGMEQFPRMDHPKVWEALHVKPFQLPDKRMGEILTGPEFFRFTFVRNPFDRALSAYLDKIVRRRGRDGVKKGFQQVSNAWKAMGRDDDGPTTFEEFLACIESIPDTKRDKHYRTQSDITQQDFIDYHFIGRLETFETDLAEVCKRLGSQSVPEARNSHATAARENRRAQYSPEAVDKVLEIYATDFERFDYPTDPF